MDAGADSSESPQGCRQQQRQGQGSNPWAGSAQQRWNGLTAPTAMERQSNLRSSPRHLPHSPFSPVPSPASLRHLLVVGGGGRDRPWPGPAAAGGGSGLSDPQQWGTAALGDCGQLNVGECDADGLIAACHEQAIDLVVIGPERPRRRGGRSPARRRPDGLRALRRRRAAEQAKRARP